MSQASGGRPILDPAAEPDPGPAPGSAPPAVPDVPAGPAGQPARTRLSGSALAAAWATVTRRGRAALAALVGAALLGGLTGWREWTGLAAGLAVLMVIAVAMALGRSPVAIDLDLARTRFVVGDPAAVRVGVRNVSNRRMLPLRPELDVDGLPAQVRVPSLPGGAGHPVVIPLPTHRRGVIELGPARAVRGDVFGLLRRVVQWPVREQVYVHPRTVRRWIAAGALSTVGARAGGSSRVLIRRKNLAALLAGLNT